MTAKHTPGPWSVFEHSWCETSIRAPSTDNALCRLDINHATEESQEADEEQMAANARLIAAAPDLLEACQTFAEWLRREDAGFPAETRFKTPEGEAKWREWFDENIRICALAQKQARAAIAKATQKAGVAHGN